MWGNRTGWLISAGISVVTIIFYAMLLLGPSITDPTSLTTTPGSMSALSLPGSPRTLVPAGTGADGTSLYLQAIDAFKADPDKYDPAKVGKLNLAPAELKKLTALELLLQASEASKATIFATKPEMIIKYGAAQFDALKPLEDLGRLSNNLGVRLKIAKKPEQAKLYLEAAFNLGYAMCNERLTYMEFYRGQELMQNAAINLSDVDKAREKEFKGFAPQMSAFLDDKHFKDMRDAIRTVSAKVIERNAGDVFNIAQNGEDRMWRIEAIMAIGHFRYMAVNPGDQRGAKTVLDKMAADSSLEPPVATAVKAAQNLTAAEHNTSAQMP